MLIKEIIEQEVNTTYQVELTDVEVVHLHQLLHEWATAPDICGTDLFAELRDMVATTMTITWPEARAISGCFESTDDFDDLYHKFSSIKRPSRGDPCWHS